MNIEKTTEWEKNRIHDDYDYACALAQFGGEECFQNLF